MRESIIRVVDVTYRAEAVTPTGVRATFAGTDRDEVRSALDRCFGSEYYIDIDREENLVEEISFDRALMDICFHLERGERIAAIKRLRDLSGIGLYDSKQLVDRIIAVGANRAPVEF